MGELLTVLCGDSRDKLRGLKTGSVHMIATSVPYWGLRTYKTEPLIWGGIQDCEHDWNGCGKSRHKPDRPVTGKAQNGSGTFGSDAPRGSQKSKAARGEILHFGDVCAKCGAWAGELGLEPTPQMWVEHLLEIFREAKRVLRDDGTLWLNCGDAYVTKPIGSGSTFDPKWPKARDRKEGLRANRSNRPEADLGLKHKDVVGLAWQLAFALRNDGWYLRANIIEEVELYCPCGCGFVLEERIWRHSPDREIIWEKPACYPESVKDRPTRSHEHIFLLSKQQRYFYDAEAISEPASPSTHVRYANSRNENHKNVQGDHQGTRSDSQTIARGFGHVVSGVHPKARKERGREEQGLKESARFGHGPGWRSKQNASFAAAVKDVVATRNKRSVWTIQVTPYPGAHWATFPPGLIEPMILASTSARGCCPDCGAPWERVLGCPERAPGRTSGNLQRKLASEENGRLNTHLGSSIPYEANFRETLGWQPTCQCYGLKRIPDLPRKGSSESDEDFITRYQPAHKRALRALKKMSGLQTVPCTVLDPFGGSGTTGEVALQLARAVIIIELQEGYVPLIHKRCEVTYGLPLS